MIYTVLIHLKAFDHTFPTLHESLLDINLTFTIINLTY